MISYIPLDASRLRLQHGIFGFLIPIGHLIRQGPFIQELQGRLIQVTSIPQVLRDSDCSTTKTFHRT